MANAAPSGKTSKEKEVVKYVGQIGWRQKGQRRQEVQIDRAIQRPQGEIVIDFRCEGYRYTVTLHRQIGNDFRGVFTGTNASEQSRGTATCQIADVASRDCGSKRESLLIGGQLWPKQRSSKMKSKRGLDNEVVSMADLRGETAHGIAVSLVYTPPR